MESAGQAPLRRPARTADRPRPTGARKTMKRHIALLFVTSVFAVLAGLLLIAASAGDSTDTLDQETL